MRTVTLTWLPRLTACRWGWPFLDQAFLYHARRLDLRHNFSPYWYPIYLASTGDARFNRLWTLMGNPCVNVPALADSAGLPVGVQVIAAFGRDDNALAAAAFVEQALGAHG